jgi:ribonuclease E
MPDGVLIDHHRDRMQILEYFRVNAAIREALKPRVDLPSGGYIIIEPTEALTVIDVNSGSFTRSATARETVLWTNCEAATEIARQLRLRNLAGVIIVDFIDMDSRRDQLQVLEHFNKALKGDKARPQIAQLSELGLVELTRKRQGQNIYELFGRPCPSCGGLGHLVHLPGESDRPLKELAEPAVPVALREPRTLDIPESFDIASADDTEDIDFVNHPSYLERGGLNNNNRRRRRRRGDEPVTKEESIISKGSPRPTPVLQLKSEPVAETEVLEPVERVGKPQLVKSSREMEPPEIIAVEMTPEEQDVYALMGISPLVRLNREIKNPKSVILSVVLPGESSQTDTSSEEPEEFSTEAPILSFGSDEAGTSEHVTVVSSAEAPATDEARRRETLTLRETSSVELPATGITTDPTPTSESDNSSLIIRRRRRRSSANSEDSTAGW